MSWGSTDEIYPGCQCVYTSQESSLWGIILKKIDVRSIFNPVLFWDAAEIDPDEHYMYVIARVLDFGNEKDIRKLLELYSLEKIAEVVRRRRGLLPQTGKFWAVKLGIPLEEVACLRKYYPKKD